MAYCTIEDLKTERVNEEKLSELSHHAPQDEGDDGYPLNEDRIQGAIDDAAAIIDSHIGAAVTLPVTAAAALAYLRERALDIAEWKLFSIYGLPSEDARARYDETMRLLRDLRDGKGGLPGLQSSASGSISYEANERTLTLTTLEGLL